MEPLIKKLEKENGVTVERLEVWHDKKNMETLSKYDKDSCGGVPFFINTETRETICGEASYDELKSWALGHAGTAR